MSEGRWIKKHDADTLDPEYRKLVGQRSWLLDYMKSICDWETGIVDGWKDATAAEDMGMPATTVRNQRQEMQNAGLITCQQGFQSQSIIIHGYLPPILTNPLPINPPKEGTDYAAILKNRIPTESSYPYQPNLVTHAPSKSVTPSYSQTLTEGKPAHKDIAVFEMIDALAKVCLIDVHPNYKLLRYNARNLIAVPYSPAEITKHFSQGGAWYKQDWRGQRGDPPTPSQVVALIKRFSTSVINEPVKKSFTSQRPQ